MPWAASSTTTARLYAATPSLRRSTTSSTDAGERAEQIVLNRPVVDPGPESERAPAGRRGVTLRDLGGREVAAGARVRAVRRPTASRRGAVRTRPRGSPVWCRSTRRSAPATSAGRSRRRTGRSGRTGRRPVRPNPGRARSGRPAAGRSAPGWTRSRSSIRTRNDRPVDRAKSQASSAVRRLPTCRSPDGLGANRPAPRSPAASSPVIDADAGRLASTPAIERFLLVGAQGACLLRGQNVRRIGQ